MIGFLGEYDATLDAKGRFLLPAGFRKQLPETSGNQFVINRGFESCLTLYTMDQWQGISQKLNELNDFNPKVREFKRLFLNGATIVDLDSAGRMNLPKSLMESAGLKKEIIFSAQGNKVEIWDKDKYYKYIQDSAASFSNLAAEVAGGDFFNPFTQA